MGTWNTESVGGQKSYSFAWSPDGDQFITVGSWPIFTGDEKGYTTGSYFLARMWNANNGIMIWEQHLNLDYSFSLSWSPDGQYLLFIGPTQENFLLVDAVSGREVPFSSSITNIDRDIHWSPTGQILMGLGEGGSQVIFKYLATGVEEKRSHPAGTEVTPKAWLPDGRLLVASSIRGQVYQEYWIISPKDERWIGFDAAK